MSDELIADLQGYYNHCMRTEQVQVADLIGRALAALTSPQGGSKERAALDGCIMFSVFYYDEGTPPQEQEQ